MQFGEKLKKLRLEKGLSQLQLSQLLEVSLKTISKYEVENTRPRYRKTYERLGEIFQVDINYLLTDEEDFLLLAKEKYGYHGAKQAKQLVENVVGLFAGAELPEEDKDALFQVLQQAYWEAKMENKKYRSKTDRA